VELGGQLCRLGDLDLLGGDLDQLLIEGFLEIGLAYDITLPRLSNG